MAMCVLLCVQCAASYIRLVLCDLLDVTHGICHLTVYLVKPANCIVCGLLLLSLCQKHDRKKSCIF